MDALTLKSKLNSLAGDELIAAVQYLIAMNSAVGASQKAMRDEFEQHYKDEVEHFNWLSSKMMELNMVPELDLLVLISNASNKYTKLLGNKTTYLTEFFRDREDEAVKSYTTFHEEIKDQYPILDNVIMDIINQESDHRLDMSRQLGETSIEEEPSDKITNLSNMESLMSMTEEKFFQEGKKARRLMQKGQIKNPNAVLNKLLLELGGDLGEINHCKDKFREGFEQNFSEGWVQDVETEWTPPAGLFKEDADTIVKVLKQNSVDKSQAMSRLNFYINRAGTNLTPDSLVELEKAKDILSEMTFSQELLEYVTRRY